MKLTRIAIAVALAATLLAAEAALRRREASLSLDIAHIRAIPSIAANLAGSDKPSVLFIGNSLTRYAVDAGLVSGTLAANGSPSNVFLIHPDDTTLTDWHYLYQTFLLNRGLKPRTLVVSFALAQLEDNQNLHAERLGRYFASSRAIPELFRHDLTASGDRVSFLLSSASALYANRERIRDRFLYTAIPFYAQTAQEVNFARLRSNSAKSAKEKTPPTFRKLERFLAMTSAAGVRTIVVAMPQPELYPIPASLPGTIGSHHARFLDMRELPGLSPDLYPDGYHLGPAGAKVFSESLATRLAKLDNN